MLPPEVMPSHEAMESRLRQDLGASEESSRELAHLLAAWEAPEASQADTARLVRRLKGEMGQAVVEERQDFTPLAGWLESWWPGMLLKTQARVVRAEIPWASVLVMGLGTLVTVAAWPESGRQPAPGVLPLVLLAPVVAALGVAFLYTPDEDPLVEIEVAAPTPMPLVLLARLALVFGFNLALGLASSLAAAAWLPELSVGALVTAWLAPMAFLTGLAFFLAIAIGGPGISTALCLVLWGWHAARGLTIPAPMGWNFPVLPDLASPAAGPWLWAMAVLLVGAAIGWAGGREARLAPWSGRKYSHED